ncbi:MAG TPA: haloacid dehalogenase type II [Terriglobales bacterium]|nr:haloacid dehalogenase type II [Terriglobales bacterium]
MPGIIAFDVNETLLDLSALDSRFQSIFGDPGVRREWFEQVLKLAFVSTIVGSYSDFGAIGRAALLVVEERRKKSLSERQRLDTLQTMRRLPAHPDVKEGFRRLRDRGWRLVALTNSTLEAAEVQLNNAGLHDDLERVFSADSVRRLKPAAEPYQMAARELGITTSDLLFVAAHSWDIAGAAKAGCRTAFLARPGQVLDQLTPKPAFTAADLGDLADQLMHVGHEPAE